MRNDFRRRVVNNQQSQRRPYTEKELRRYAESMGHTMMRGPPVYSAITKTRRPDPLHGFLNEVLKRFLQDNKVTTHCGLSFVPNVYYCVDSSCVCFFTASDYSCY